MAVWKVSFPGGIGNENIKWRALIWAMSEGLLILSVTISYLPPKVYSGIFKFGIIVMMLDFFLCVIWLPIGVSKTYGFRSAKDVFTATCTSAELMFYGRASFHPRQWNWCTGGMELALILVCV
jgi:hypothetical protein